MRYLHVGLTVFSLLAAGCAEVGDEPVTTDPTELQSDAKAALPDVQCKDTPATGAAGRFRHFTSSLISLIGSPRHRGIDLVAPASATVQTVEGEISYGVNDKALEDEWVQLYACRSGSWVYLGPVLTDGEGHFSLALGGSARLPVGQRDLFVSVFGDRTSARFLALVTPAGTKLAVTDIDGTLTSSENAFTNSLVTGGTVGVQPDAAAALGILQTRGYAIVYVSARGRYFSASTLSWLAANGFPRGPHRLAPGLLTLPGDATAQFKASAIAGLGAPVTVAIGNRTSDVAAYRATSVPSAKTFVKLPEYQSELQPYLDSGQAVGFDSFASLLPVLRGL